MQAIRSRLFRSLLGVVAALLVALGGSGFVQAATNSATSQNITMTPSATELSVVPGGSTTNSFDVINEGSNPYNIAVSVAPYHVEGTDYDPQFTPLPGTTDASKWVHITSLVSRTLKAHELVNTDYTLNVPAGTMPGGYYAVLFAETTPVTTSSTGVVSHNRVGDILYITVKGPVRVGGSVQAFSIPYITTASSVPLSMLVSNTGGVHFLTNATVTVKSIFGNKVFQASLQRYVLPQTVRKISTSWNNTPPIGLYKVSRSASVAGVTKTLSTRWVLVVRPWVIIAFAVLVLIIVGEAVLRRKNKHSEVKKE